jgi:hypothetical protein
VERFNFLSSLSGSEELEFGVISFSLLKKKDDGKSSEKQLSSSSNESSLNLNALSSGSGAYTLSAGP